MFSDQGPGHDKESLHKMFPLNDAVIKRVQVPREVTSPLYSDKNVRVNSNCFELKVPGTGAFFACDGNMAEYSIEPGADPEWVQVRRESIEKGGQISRQSQISLWRATPYSPFR